MMGRTQALVRAAVGDFQLTPSEQLACAHLLTVLVYGERIAEVGARGQALIAPTDSARRFLRKQARHEAFHARVFRMALDLLRPPGWRPAPVPRPLAALQGKIEAACRRGDFPGSLLLQQVYLEGLGHIMLERLDGELARVQRLSRLRRLILEQEALHHQFGLEMLGRHVVPETPQWRALRPEIRRLDQLMDDFLGELQQSLQRLDPQAPCYPAAFRQSLPEWVRSAV